MELTRQDQYYLFRRWKENPSSVPDLMMKLIAEDVTNKTHDLTAIAVIWGIRHNKPKLVASTIENLLYNFDVEEAFKEGLMDVSELEDLMDYQNGLAAVYSTFFNDVGKEKKDAHNSKVDGDNRESDAGSTDMELGESS